MKILAVKALKFPKQLKCTCLWKLWFVLSAGSRWFTVDLVSHHHTLGQVQLVTPGSLPHTGGTS